MNSTIFLKLLNGTRANKYFSFFVVVFFQNTVLLRVYIVSVSAFLQIIRAQITVVLNFLLIPCLRFKKLSHVARPWSLAEVAIQCVLSGVECVLSGGSLGLFSYNVKVDPE